MHVTDPEDGLYIPAGQLMQVFEELAPSDKLNDPARQDEQLANDVAPDTVP